MRARPLRFAATCLAASSLLFAAACGGAADAKESPKKPQGPQPLTAAQAKSVLIGAADLPDGWKLQKDTVLDQEEVNQSTDFGKAEQADCQVFLDVVNTGRLLSDYKVGRQQLFARDGDTSTLGQDVSGYPVADSESAMKKLAGAVKSCTTFDTTYEGKAAKARLKKVDLPPLGDEAVGYRMHFESNGYAIDFEIATVRVGANITTILHNWGEDERGEKDFRQAYTKAAANLKKALSGDSAAK
ncbi:hypothetical protein [Streptomyces sp. NBC_01304]|uniref:hypothetical protein n=1 Tax=Streptomyces sp. NBC_01304 TaxID=2903818 RepID=UPI002E0DE471|nr:hypothetical protein OG430_31985 [Streptomyces sp. NBC_01304]